MCIFLGLCVIVQWELKFTEEDSVPVPFKIRAMFKTTDWSAQNLNRLTAALRRFVSAVASNFVVVAVAVGFLTGDASADVVVVVVDSSSSESLTSTDAKDGEIGEFIRGCIKKARQSMNHFKMDFQTVFQAIRYHYMRGCRKRSQCRLVGPSVASTSSLNFIQNRK